MSSRVTDGLPRRSYSAFTTQVSMVFSVIGLSLFALPHVGFIALASMTAQLAKGQVRVLAVATPSRFKALPDMQTFEEAGLSGYDVINWFGVVAPRGTSGEIVHNLNAHLNKALANLLIATT